jgi:hypothetical protein
MEGLFRCVLVLISATEYGAIELLAFGSDID